MKTEEIIDRLRNPQKYNKKVEKSVGPTVPSSQTVAQQEEDSKTSLLVVCVAFGVLIAAALVWFVMINAKSRAEDISAALDPKTAESLTADTDFNPSTGITYVQVQEGQDRNVAVDELGTTLPIINRFNYQSITP